MYSLYQRLPDTNTILCPNTTCIAIRYNAIDRGFQTRSSQKIQILSKLSVLSYAKNLLSSILVYLYLLNTVKLLYIKFF